jgi:hypothetical protein
MVLEIARSALGSDDLRGAVIMDDLGVGYVAQNRYSEADSLLKQAQLSEGNKVN